MRRAKSPGKDKAHPKPNLREYRDLLKNAPIGIFTATAEGRFCMEGGATAFEDLFNMEEIQRLQDEFAMATGVSSLITRPDGTPLTVPSNFTYLCSELIRKTEKGRLKCAQSDAAIGRCHPDGPLVGECLSAGLWNAGASITVGGRHIANWLIGQVRDSIQTEERMRTFAREVGADEEAFVRAFLEVPTMPKERFEQIARALFTLANQLSTTAYQNVQQARVIAERKQIEETLLMTRFAMDRAPDSILWIDDQGNLIYANDAACTSMGYTREELLAMQVFDVDPDFSRAGWEQHKTKLRRLGSMTFEGRHRTKDGRLFPVEVTTNYFEYKGRFVGIAFDRDITSRRKREEALRESERKYRELSIIDGLTQLFNSRHFYDRLKLEIDRVNRYGVPLSLILFDLDNFKAFNDRHGHVEGDRVLTRLGQAVNGCLRNTDSAYRYGGEEFTVLLPMTRRAEGIVIAERIRTEFKKENFSPTPGEEVHLALSMGIGQYRPQEDLKAFVNRVDQLMYQAKKEGKDRICSEP